MKINMRISFAGLVVAAIAVFAGWVLLGGVGELAERTEQAIAVYEDSRLTYTTQAGQTVTIPAWTECKNFSRLTDECVGYYANGDEVLVTFDSAEPSRTWRGPTPGGQLAAGLFWGGIALGIFSLLWLWFTSPLYRRLRRPEIAGQASLPNGED